LQILPTAARGAMDEMHIGSTAFDETGLKRSAIELAPNPLAQADDATIERKAASGDRRQTA
jgi:hypothetical protein